MKQSISVLCGIAAACAMTVVAAGIQKNPAPIDQSRFGRLLPSIEPPIVNESHFRSAGPNQGKMKSLKLEAGTPLALRLTGSLGKDSSNDRAASLVTVNDITIDEVVVIPKGSAAIFNIVRQDAKKFNLPGELKIVIEGVYTISGHLVAVRGGKDLIGEPACNMQDCIFLPALFWKKGDRPSLPAETLFAVRVSQTTLFNRDLIERITRELSERVTKSPPTGDARLHLYQEYSGYSSVIHLDGKRVGNLKAGQYACLGLPPGSHIISVDKYEIEIDATSGSEYFAKLFSTATSSVVQTPGYQFESGQLELARGKPLKGQTPCF